MRFDNCKLAMLCRLEHNLMSYSLLVLEAHARSSLEPMLKQGLMHFKTFRGPHARRVSCLAWIIAHSSATSARWSNEVPSFFSYRRCVMID